MKFIELCMKYDTCKRCPLNKQCEAEFQKEQRKKDDRKQRKEKRKAKGMYDV